jgi:hypothetical protein
VERAKAVLKSGGERLADMPQGARTDLGSSDPGLSFEAAGAELMLARLANMPLSDLG